jgi:FHA domain
MFEPLEKVDTSVIDELVLLKRDREILAQRLARMVEDQDKVSEAVFQRVRRDYESRSATLDKSAAPLKDQGRREFAKLRSLLVEVENARTASRLDKEELEFRNRLGEYEGGEYQRRLDEVTALLAKQDEQIAEISAVRERFLNAFDSEADLTAAPAPVPAKTPPLAPAPPVVAAPPPPPAFATDATRVSPAAAPPIVEMAGTLPGGTRPGAQPSGPPPLPGDDGTIASAPAAAAPAAAPDMGATVVRPSLALPASPPTSRTLIYQRGKLVPQANDLGASEFLLDPLTFIGRTPQNQVQVPKPSVSRRHAQVSLTDQGYVLKDLGSENGSYVNGERITEKLLAEGDRVQIGTVGFVFHVG